MKFKDITLTCCLVFLIAGILNAQTISVSLDKEDYVVNDKIHVSISASNGPSNITVDLYFALLTPLNQLLFFPMWTEDLNCLDNIPLPANFNLPETEVFAYTLPSMMPWIQDTGEYTFAIGLTNPGTLDFISIDTAQFSYTAGEKENLVFLIVDLNRDYSAENINEITTISLGAYEFETGADPDSVCPPLEGCIFKKYEYNITEPPPNIGGTISKGLDAGEQVLVSGSPNGDLNLIRTDMPGYPGYYYEPERDLLRTDFAFENSYAFSGNGGADVAAFNDNVTTLGDFNISSPKLGPGLQITKSQPLDITWTNPMGSPYELQVMITSSSMDIVNMKSIMTFCQCRFIDDGSATIPKENLEGLVVPLPYFGGSNIVFAKVLQEVITVGGVNGKTESSITDSCDCTLK